MCGVGVCGRAKKKKNEKKKGANRRLLRKNLRQLVGDVHDKGAELKTGSEDARRQTRELYEKAEDLAGAVKHPREYLVLAQVEAEIGSVVLAQVSRVDVSSHQDNPTEFAVKVKSWLAPPAERLDDEDHQGERVDDRAAERERWRALGALLPKVRVRALFPFMCWRCSQMVFSFLRLLLVHLFYQEWFQLLPWFESAKQKPKMTWQKVRLKR